MSKSCGKSRAHPERQPWKRHLDKFHQFHFRSVAQLSVEANNRRMAQNPSGKFNATPWSLLRLIFAISGWCAVTGKKRKNDEPQRARCRGLPWNLFTRRAKLAGQMPWLFFLARRGKDLWIHMQQRKHLDAPVLRSVFQIFASKICEEPLRPRACTRQKLPRTVQPNVAPELVRPVAVHSPYGTQMPRAGAVHLIRLPRSALGI